MKISSVVCAVLLMGLAWQGAEAVQMEIGDAPVNSVTALSKPQELPVKVDVEVLLVSPRVGDEIPIAVRITARPDITIEPMAYKKALGDWDVLAVNSTGTQYVGNAWQRTDQLVVQNFLAGEAEFPALIQKYKTKDGKPGEFRSLPIKITVAPLPVKESDKPGSIRGLKKPEGLFSWWLAGIIAGVCLVLGAGIWWYLRRTQRQLFAQRPKVPPRPAHSVALEKLDALQQSQLLIQGQFKVYYSVLSDILRRYIEARFQTPAIDMTTRELIRALKPQELKTQDNAVLRNVLTQSDMVKFAKLIPNEKDTNNDWQAVRDMIIRTAEASGPEKTDSGEGAGV